MLTLHTPRLLAQPFLIVRLAIFLILSLLNFLALIFSAWNIAALKGNPSFGPSFALFNSCLFLVLALLALAAVLFPYIVTSLVKFELGWTGLLSVFNFAASIIVTRDGPQIMCQSQINISVCTSTMLLIPVSWLASILVLLYFTTLLIMTAIHIQIYPNIDNVPVTSAPWFNIHHRTTPPMVSKPSAPVNKQQSHKEDIFGFYGDDIIHADVEKQTLSAVRDLPAIADKVAENPSSDVVGHTPQWADDEAAEDPSLNVVGHMPQWAADEVAENPFLNRVGQWAADNVAENPFLNVIGYTPRWAEDANGNAKRAVTPPFKLSTSRPIDDDGPRRKSSSYWSGGEDITPPQNVRTGHQIGERTFEVDRKRSALDMQSLPRPLLSISYAGTVTSRQDKRVGVIIDGDRARESVSSMFPQSLPESAWNQPLKKPSFNNGQGEGWRTANFAQSSGQARGWRV